MRLLCYQYFWFVLTTRNLKVFSNKDCPAIKLFLKMFSQNCPMILTKLNFKFVYITPPVVPLMTVRWLRFRQTQAIWALLFCLSVSLPPGGEEWTLGWSIIACTVTWWWVRILTYLFPFPKLHRIRMETGSRMSVRYDSLIPLSIKAHF